MSMVEPEIRSRFFRSGELIRQKVEHRHWQLFETRLKNTLPTNQQENYTKSNDYRVIDRLKKVDRPQPPVEPDRRWNNFCSQLTNKSNETTRLMSIFHNVWVKNWNATDEQTKVDSNSKENQLWKFLAVDEEEKKIISSILHQ